MLARSKSPPDGIPPPTTTNFPPPGRHINSHPSPVRIAVTHLARGEYKARLRTTPTPKKNPLLTWDCTLNTGIVADQCGHFEEASKIFARAVRQAHELGSPPAEAEAEAEAQAYEASASCRHQPEKAKTQALAAIHAKQQTGNLADKQRSLIARAIPTAGTAPPEQVETIIHQAKDIAHHTGNSSGILRVHIARSWLPGHTPEHTKLAKRRQWLDRTDETMRRRRKLLEDRRTLTD